jgi:hypothetical protein
MIVADVDQAGWGSSKIYDDGDLSGFWVPDKVIIHWGGNTDTPGADPEWEKDRLRRWQNYHINGRKWRDIAYNYAVGQSGFIYRLRGQNPSGATSGDYEGDGIRENAEGIAVVWIGGAQTAGGPTVAAYLAMHEIIVGSGMNVVIGHKDVSPRACPGPEWMDYIFNRPWEGQASPPRAEGTVMNYRKIVQEHWGPAGLDELYDAGAWLGSSKNAGIAWYMGSDVTDTELRNLVEVVFAWAALEATIPADGTGSDYVLKGQQTITLT